MLYVVFIFAGILAHRADKKDAKMVGHHKSLFKKNMKKEKLLRFDRELSTAVEFSNNMWKFKS